MRNMDCGFLPLISMLNILTLHFVFTICSLFGDWYGRMYVIYNSLFIIFLFLCVIGNPTITSLNYAIRINLTLIIFDIAIFCHVFTTYYFHYMYDYVGVSFGVLNFICRFITIPMTIKIYKDTLSKTESTDCKSDSQNKTSLDTPADKEAVAHSPYEQLSKNLPPYQP